MILIWQKNQNTFWTVSWTPPIANFLSKSLCSKDVQFTENKVYLWRVSQAPCRPHFHFIGRWTGWKWSLRIQVNLISLSKKKVIQQTDGVSWSLVLASRCGWSFSNGLSDEEMKCWASATRRKWRIYGRFCEGLELVGSTAVHLHGLPGEQQTDVSMKVELSRLWALEPGSDEKGEDEHRRKTRVSQTQI